MLPLWMLHTKHNKCETRPLHTITRHFTCYHNAQNSGPNSDLMFYFETPHHACKKSIAVPECERKWDLTRNYNQYIVALCQY